MRKRKREGGRGLGIRLPGECEMNGGRRGAWKMCG